MGRSRSRSSASDGRPRPTPTPLDVAARLLVRTPLTEAALEERLVARGYRPATAAATVARCRELGYVNDAVFARERARTLRRRGAGSLRIEADLVARGLPEALVAEVVAASRDGEAEISWARRALRGERCRDRRRSWAFLVGRGFPEDVVGELLREP
jgi:regulatory protein